MSYYKSDLYKDYGTSGDLSDISEVDADELAAILGEVGGGNQSATADSRGKKKAEEKKVEDKEDERGRGDWLGLTDTPTTPASRSRLTTPSVPQANIESVAGRSRTGDSGGRRDNRQDLIKELFGGSKWASDKEKDPLGLKEEVGKVEEKSKIDDAKVRSEGLGFGTGSVGRFRNRGSLQDSSETSASYVPSNTAPRRPRRLPSKPLDIEDFGFSDILGDKKEDNVSKDVPGFDSVTPIKEKKEVVPREPQGLSDFKATSPYKQSETSTRIEAINTQEIISNEHTVLSSHHPSSLLEEKINPPPNSLIAGVSSGMMPSAPRHPDPSFTAPVGTNVVTGSLLDRAFHNLHGTSGEAVLGQIIYPQFYPLPQPTVAQLPTGGGEMVEELRSAQATFGAALTAHHTNIQSYMQLLLDEARRLAVVTKITSNISKDKLLKTEKDEELDSEIVPNEDEEEKIDKFEETTQTDYEITQHTSLRKVDSDDQNKQKEIDLAEQKRQLEFALHEETMQQMKEFRIIVQRLEIENSNLTLKLENLKLQHDMEIEFLKKTNAQEALLWESRIEKIQHFCYSVEKEYAEKIDKMKLNEEELIRSHKARLETLQSERLSDMKQLSDLHKAIMEQALSSSIMYSRDRMPKVIVKSLEKPANEEELTEREAALLRKEKQLEESKLEWEEERRRGMEAALEKERAVREAETTWVSRREAESRQLARREARIEELSRLVEEMREQALTEAKEMAADKLKVQTDRARLEALMKAESGVMANPEHILQMRADVEAGLEESKEMKSVLDNERRRLGDEWNRLEARVLEVEARERDVARIKEDLIREREEASRERNEYTRKKEEAQKAQARANTKEEEAVEKTAHLEQQIREIAKERLEVKKDRLEIETAKTRLDLLLPELGPNEPFTLNPLRNYVDPKAIIMRLKAERELESFNVTPTSRSPFS